MYNLSLRNPTIQFMDIFDTLFDESLDITSRKCPAHDIIENDNEYIIEMELAGVKKEDISVDTKDNVLIIEAERKRDNKHKYNRKELYFGKYKRSFTLPNNADINEIEGKMKEGMLIVTIPKIINKKKIKKTIEIT